ncbi:S-layer homology domain-containing protein [Alkaliphilus serpentinus]|uniref:S-layer homology domain-containing protein n=1 Tax=Alkaliphilus serpentinus TaxID=1482731 RepID=A0A833HNE9_9FIRM|nr:S-layer homology domain-containing protein [Alkaliphilus serpentinus]KAB3529326.1 S-layer homology domain-containing protein [Alkaliphilus serpentinus]
MRRKILYLLCSILVFTNIAFTYAVEADHWVTDELVEFKNFFTTYSKILTKEEAEIIKDSVFDEGKLDEAIATYNWAILVKTTLELDTQKNPQLMDMYIYNLAKGNTITREAAVGGLVKLLTLEYLDGSIGWEEAKATEVLVDLKEISDMQLSLVQMAYIEGLLDSRTITQFRPREELTNAEAVSMLNRVIKKYRHPEGINNNREDLRSNQDHWGFHHIKSYVNTVELTTEELDLIDRMAESYESLNDPISLKNWNALLLTTLGFDINDEVATGYTLGLSDDGCIRRGEAVAGMVKLLHIKNFVIGRDASQEELAKTSKALKDYNEAFDKSKLSIAYVEGLIQGYGDGTFRPNQYLTNGEAFVILNTLANKFLIK